MKEKEIKRKCLNLMESADAAYLGTISSDGFPHIRMMGNLRNKEQNPGLVDLFKQHSDEYIFWLTYLMH